jgi:hypothetical protein
MIGRRRLAAQFPLMNLKLFHIELLDFTLHAAS